jgi:hypothetical protein
LTAAITPAFERITSTPRYGTPSKDSGAAPGTIRSGPNLATYPGRKRFVVTAGKPFRIGRRQHPHPSRVRRPESRAAVVVGEDPLVAPAVAGEALRAPLAHANPVTPAAALGHEDRRGGGGGREQQAGDGDEQEATHERRRVASRA